MRCSLLDQRGRDTAACVYMSLQVAVYGLPQTEKQRATRMKVIWKATAHEKGKNVGGFHQRGGELQMSPPSTWKKEWVANGWNFNFGRTVPSLVWLIWLDIVQQGCWLGCLSRLCQQKDYTLAANSLISLSLFFPPLNLSPSSSLTPFYPSLRSGCTSTPSEAASLTQRIWSPSSSSPSTPS